MIIRKANIHDVDAIFDLIDLYAKEDLLLPRTHLSLYENIQCIRVAEQDGEIVGAGSLHVLGRDLAEIRSLVIAPEAKGLGIGRKLVYHLIEEAEQLGVENVFAMTYQVDFFKKCGFTIVDKEILPQKIWKDCLNCPKFLNCDETAMLIKVADYKKMTTLH
ncbi:N-acetyltransferase [Calidifontibacillus erzurumensis]|uniref:N-acetyltransferase n=2 Tax=Calidifontibacillus erzurumensis TaxID=2741433 RepID=A0A8J8GF45_9BACI|nr:N-acetyltransferase [Calidifontibacillus erzurumensis]NSL50668.1 N-acetyltransferase [Calidifontibacillus erzurumensis]